MKNLAFVVLALLSLAAIAQVKPRLYTFNPVSEKTGVVICVEGTHVSNSQQTSSRMIRVSCAPDK